ncbi:alpha/beta-hydrolase, partial [Colletotrichum zoysiae]
ASDTQRYRCCPCQADTRRPLLRPPPPLVPSLATPRPPARSLPHKLPGLGPVPLSTALYRHLHTRWLKPLTPRAPVQKGGGGGGGGAGAGTGRNGPRPLHVDCHAGGFVGGIPEASAPFCSLVAAETGAIAVSLSYRLSPVHPFPAAVDVVDPALAWLRRHAAEELGADPTLMTVSGASAGGNLVLAAAQAAAMPSEEFAVRAAVTFYAPVDLRPRPEDKPRPANFPERDATSFTRPLYDSYAAPAKAKDLDNPARRRRPRGCCSWSLASTSSSKNS